METRRQTLSDCDSCGRTTAATYFPQCNTTASLTPGATTSCFIATETAYSKGTQNDYRFGFCSCGFSASPVETITQPFLPNYRAPHNYLTMLSHTSTFDYRSKAIDWHFRFAFSPPSSTLTALLSFTYPVLAIPSIHRDPRFVDTDDQSSFDTQFDRPKLPCLGRAQVCSRLESCLTLAQVSVQVFITYFENHGPLA